MSAPLPTIIYLDRDKLSFCDTKSAAAVVFPFPAGLVKDLEVTNYDLLLSQLKAFLSQRKVSPTNLVFILAPTIYFEKNLTHLSEEQRQNETQKYLETIPFDSVSSKLFHLNNEHKLVAINRDYYESFRTAFEQLGFVVTAVVPVFVFGHLGGKEAEFNYESCRLISKSLDFIYENSFISPNQEDQSLTQKRRHFLREHSIIFTLISLLCVLMALVTAYFTVIYRPHKSSVPPAPVVLSAPTVTLAPSATPSPVSLAELSVVVQTNPKGSPAFKNLTSQLQSLGLTHVASSTSSAVSAGTLIVYSPRVPQSLRGQIGDLLLSLSASPSAQENPQSQSDILIVLGQAKK